MQLSSFAFFSRETGEDINEMEIENFSIKIAEYTKLINEALKEYAKIDYSQEQEKKIKAKSEIKFAYDFLNLVSKILRAIDSYPKVSVNLIEDIDLLGSRISGKASLIATIYKQAAKEELEAFHDKNFRDLLSLNLEKLNEKRIKNQK
ncbi:MAG: hypothetical protein ACTSVI_13615 [Promethearchaeota archaeon]